MALYIFAGIFFLVFGLDLILKQYVEENVGDREVKKVKFTGGKLLIRKVYNKGAFLRFMEKRAGFVKYFSAAVGAGIAAYDVFLFRKKGHPVLKTGMTLISAGAASNLFDRFGRGKVIDYIGVDAGPAKVRQITWNLADLSILAGTVLTMIAIPFQKVKKK